jgi:hypothetical protein
MIDTVNWLLLESQYTAAGGEEYFSFGNFFPDKLTDTTPIVWGTPPNEAESFFYVEDVYVGSCDVGIQPSPDISALSIFPNPTNHSQIITVRFSKAMTAPGYLMVFDSRGQEPHSWPLAKGQQEVLIDTSPLVPGFYLMQCITTSTCTVTKFIMQ